ncbi:MAG: MarR family winged helix-turn-helix transcriptional regulator [Candidatus Angelobacter sp.]
MSRKDLIQEIVENMARCQRPVNFTGWQEFGVSHAQVGLLYMLAYHKQLQARQLADYLGISKSAVSQLVDPLADKGLVRRRTDSRDRRIAHFSPTDRGLQLVRKLNKRKFAGLRTRLAVLTDEELERLAGLYQKMAIVPQK